MFNLFKKKDDYGYNDFQIVYYTLKWRLTILDDQHFYALNALNRAVSTYKRKLIKEKIKVKHLVEQQYKYMKQAIDLAGYVLSNYRCLFENPEQVVRDKYLELCSYRLVIGVPQLNNFWIKHQIKTDKPYSLKKIVDLTEAELESEVNKYCLLVSM